jgi:6-phosphogluconolactonase
MTDSADGKILESLPYYFRYATRAEFVHGVVDAVTIALRDTLDRQTTMTLAVPGGRTVASIVPTLAAKKLPWDRIGVVLVDERWVPPNHPDSNEGQIRALFAQSPVSVRGLFADGIKADEAVRQLVHEPPPDVVLLSMAEDGHIASLFPGEPANHAETPFAIVPRPDHVRVTMTPAHLRAARTIILAVDGAVREQLLFSAQDRGSHLPVHHVLRPDTKVHVLR